MPAKSETSTPKKNNGRNGKKLANGNSTAGSNGIGRKSRNGVNANGARILESADRRIAVARLRFGQKLPILGIAKTLHIDPKTVKADIRYLRDEYIKKDQKAIENEIACIREEIKLSFYERVRMLWDRIREVNKEHKSISRIIKDLKIELDKTHSKDKKVSIARQMAKLVESQIACQNVYLRINAQIGETEDQFTNQLQKLGVLKKDEISPISLYQLFNNDYANKSDEEKEREFAEDFRIITSGNGTKNNRL